MRHVDSGVFHAAFGQIGYMTAFGVSCGADDFVISVQRGADFCIVVGNFFVFYTIAPQQRAAPDCGIGIIAAQLLQHQAVIPVKFVQGDAVAGVVGAHINENYIWMAKMRRAMIAATAQIVRGAVKAVGDSCGGAGGSVPVTIRYCGAGKGIVDVQHAVQPPDDPHPPGVFHAAQFRHSHGE